MESLNFFINYRPVKIGFLIKENDFDDLEKAVKLNTILQGGICNPIIPVSKRIKNAETLIKKFDVDLIHPVSSDDFIDSIVKKYHHLKNFTYLNDIIGTVEKKNYIAYYDIIDTYLKISNEGLKFYSSQRSLYRTVSWNSEDELSSVFLILFGAFPNKDDCGIDYEYEYNGFLKASCIKINKNTELIPEINSFRTPLSLTVRNLIYSKNQRYLPGVYLSTTNSFQDLVNFWNLRASGVLNLTFLSNNNIERLKKYTVSFLKNMADYDFKEFVLYHRNLKEKTIANIQSQLSQENLNFKFHSFTKNWKQIKPHIFCFSDKVNSLAYIQKSENNVKINLPEKNFSHFSHFSDDIPKLQLVMATIDSSTKMKNEYVIIPPRIDLEEFYSEHMFFHIFEVRIEKEGFSTFVEIGNKIIEYNFFSFYTFAEGFFKSSNITINLSQAGIITKKIIENFEGISGLDLLKVTGIRDIIQELKSQDSITLSQAEYKIHLGDLKKYDFSFINLPKNKGKLSNSEVFKFALRKNLFRAGLELVCPSCYLTNWITLKEIDEKWKCVYCGNEDLLSPHLKKGDNWRFRKNGLFQKDNNQEGAIPVILTLKFFYDLFKHQKFIFLPALNLEFRKNKCETDFFILNDRWGETVEMGIGECKSEGGKIDKNDVKNLKLIRNQFKKKIACYIIFSKLANNFLPAEIRLFKELVKNQIPIILLTKKELEIAEIHPYSKINNVNPLPHKHVSTMQDISENSIHLYLK